MLSFNCFENNIITSLHKWQQFHCAHRLGVPEHLSHYDPTARVAVVIIEPIGNIISDISSINTTSKTIELEEEQQASLRSQQSAYVNKHVQKYLHKAFDALHEDDFVIVTSSNFI